MNGYDGSVMSSINAMAPFHEQFPTVGKTGVMNGLVFAIYTVGNLTGSFFCGFIMDKLGRRLCMMFGASFIILGSILQASSHQIGQFIAGRYVVGIGTPMCATGAPVYLVEMAYPTWRGVAGGLYNVLGYYIGALSKFPIRTLWIDPILMKHLAASWTCYGTVFISNNWAWRIPYIVQAIPATIVASVALLLPESPRWLFANNKTEKAKSILTKYHGNGNADSALVQLEMREMAHSLNFEAEISKGRHWDYRVLINTRPARYRMWLILLVAVFSQFIGGSVISYYLPVMVEGIGITDSSKQLLLNALNTVVSFVSGVAGSCFVDKFGRRPLFLWGTFLTGLVYIPINVLAHQAETMDNNIPLSQGYAFIAMIFSYGVFWSFCWTPLQALYPAEILNNEIRAKGMAAKGFISGLAGFINTFGTSVALEQIGWKTYTIFLVLHFTHLVAMYLSAVESKGRSLEELEDIFNDPKPVKRSLQRTTVIVTKGRGVKIEDDA